MLLEAKVGASSRRGIVNSDQVLVTHQVLVQVQEIALLLVSLSDWGFSGVQNWSCHSIKIKQLVSLAFIRLDNLRLNLSIDAKIRSAFFSELWRLIQARFPAELHHRRDLERTASADARARWPKNLGLTSPSLKGCHEKSPIVKIPKLLFTLDPTPPNHGTLQSPTFLTLPVSDQLARNMQQFAAILNCYHF